MESTVNAHDAQAEPPADYQPPGCPDCGPVELHPVFAGERTNHYCPLCGACWHFELGFVAPVDPATCPGCQYELVCRERRRQTATQPA